MGRIESSKHGKYRFVCSCLIAEYIEILVNNKNVRLGEFPHYKGDRPLNLKKRLFSKH
jgi:hypothetical protein